MAARTPAQVYQDLLEAGFTPIGATTMTAIAGAQSGYDDAKAGPTGYGLFGLPTPTYQTGSGGPGDIATLAGSDLAQAQAAYAVSRGGTDFSPWTTYTNGAWQGFVSNAQAAATQTATPVSWWNPFSWLTGSVQDDAVSGVATIAAEAIAAGLGVVLVGVGLAQLLKPAIQRKQAQAAKAAKIAAMVV